ncbi:MAG: alpha/beta hydrolase [Hyphomicrobiales bacterium]
MTYFQRLLLFVILATLSACGSTRVLAPTPNIYANGTYPHNDVPPAYRTATPSIFYMTDRAPVHENGKLSYNEERSNSTVFGASKVSFGKNQNWQSLSAASGAIKRTQKLPLNVLENREILRFDETPTAFKVVNGKPVRNPDAVASYNRKRSLFQAQIREQMRIANKNEVVIFVHGFNNSFEDAVYSIADIWHFSGRRGVPIAYTWPAGAGGAFGYFKDRESGEFTVFHLKEFITQLSQIPELEKIHIIAHSRGTDVTTTALRELIIAVRAQNKNPKDVLKIENLVMAAPDLDFSVVRQRLIAEGFGASIGQITVYVNPGDTALGLAQALLTGERLGKLTQDKLQPAEQKIFAELKTVNLVNVEGVKGLTGHAYYRTNRNVLSDISAIIREGSLPGTPSRPLTRIEGNFWNMPLEYPAQ